MIREHARVLACVTASQLLAAALGWAWGGRFVFAWAGAVFGAIPGLWLGFAWQRRSKGLRETARTPILIAVLAIPAATFAVGFGIPRMLREGDEIAALRRLDAGDFRRIETRDLRADGSARITTEIDALAAFTRACADAERYAPQHPSYDRTWYVVLSGPKTLELELYLMASEPSRVFGAFVEKRESTTWFHGSFQSRALRAWVDRYLVDPR